MKTTMSPSITAPVSTLPLPPEPVDALRSFAAEFERNPWLAKSALRQGDWLAGDLWRLWQPWLEPQGVSHENLRERVSDCSPYFRQWIQHEIDWVQAVSTVIRTIQPQP